MKVLVLIADGSEEIEVLTPVDYLRRANLDVTLCSVSPGRTVTCSHGVSVNTDMTLDSFLSAGGALPDAIVVPGGMPGTTNIAASDAALKLIGEMYKDKKLVCAICAAPALVLSKCNLLAGHKWTCYPGMQSQAGKESEAGYQEGISFVHDGTLITGRGPGAAEEFSMEILKTLCGNESYEKIKKGSCQR